MTENEKLAQSLVPNGIKIKITKIEELYNAEVPNNIKEGEYRIGYVRKDLLVPTIGMSYGLESVIEKNGESIPANHWFITSTVVDTWTENPPNKEVYTVIKTLNSIYKIELL